MSKEKKEDVLIVGGGMSGTVMAYILASAGKRVTIYEKREDCRNNPLEQGRSVNLTLAERGIVSLEKIGITRKKLFDMCVGLKGREIHQVNGKSKLQPYGASEDELIYSIIRYDLNCFLLDYVEKNPNIEIKFNQNCIDLNRRKKTVTFKDTITKKVYQVKPNLIIGADGTFSKIRQKMQKGLHADYSLSFLDAGYKELRIPADKDGNYQLDETNLHLWPRGKSLLIALSNNDGTFTCTCILPHRGEESFEMLNTYESCQTHFEKNYPDLLEMVPNVVETFVDSQISEFITMKTSKWSHEDWVVLLGDACHTVTPFYGQGMNTALESCWVLFECMKKHNKELDVAFQEYEEKRKVHTDVLADMSVNNYYELGDKVRNPSIDFKKKINFLLQKLFPNKWKPLYSMVAHSEIAFADAIEIERKQNRLLNLFGVGILSYLMDSWAKYKFKLKNNIHKTQSRSQKFERKEIVKNQKYIGQRID